MIRKIIKTAQQESLKNLMKKLGYCFNNIPLLEQALTHRSIGAHNNERLEFLGDAVLNAIIAARLFHLFPHAHEGELSRLRANLVNEDALAEIALAFDLGNDLKLGAGELKSGGRRRKSILSDALEAIMGAMYLDAGFEACEKKIADWFENKIKEINIHKIQALKDPKTRLQEYLQFRKLSLPVYTVLSVTGEAHDQEFNVACEIKDLNYLTKGMGVSRREAEQAAAEFFLHWIAAHQ